MLTMMICGKYGRKTKAGVILRKFDNLKDIAIWSQLWKTIFEKGMGVTFLR